MNILTKRIIASILGSLGFSIIFNLNKRYYLYVSLLSGLNYALFYYLYQYTNRLFLSSLICSIFVEIVVQILSKLLKTPRTILFIVSIIALIPGSSLYMMMKGFVLNGEYLIHALELGSYILGIAAGSSFVSAIVIFFHRLKKIRN